MINKLKFCGLLPNWPKVKLSIPTFSRMVLRIMKHVVVIAWFVFLCPLGCDEKLDVLKSTHNYDLKTIITDCIRNIDRAFWRRPVNTRISTLSVLDRNEGFKFFLCFLFCKHEILFHFPQLKFISKDKIHFCWIHVRVLNLLLD